jgi:hypothetical protein
MVLLAALSLALAACSSGSSGDSVATLDEPIEQDAVQDTQSVDADDEEALLAFAACMRENGVEDFEDPIINEDGFVEFSIVEESSEGGPGAFDESQRETIEAAFRTCEENLEGVAFGPGGTDFNFTELEDTFVEFSACMRDNGVEIDDPDFSAALGDDSGGGFIDLFGDIDFGDPDVQAAMEECQEIFAGFGPSGSTDR